MKADIFGQVCRTQFSLLYPQDLGKVLLREFPRRSDLVRCISCISFSAFAFARARDAGDIFCSSALND
jgi:hypothetical protein